MKKIIIVSLLFVSSLLLCMEPKEHDEGPRVVRRGDFVSFRLRTIKGEDEDSRQQPYQLQPIPLSFDKPFCCPIITKDYDDTLKTALVKKSLFEQLCVQASKQENKDICSFYELLTKIKHGAIDLTTSQIAITRKDLCYRLLTNIYSYSTLSSKTGNQDARINNKTVLLSLRSYETTEDKIENKNIKEQRALLPQHEWKWGEGFEPLSYYFNYSGMTLLTDYYFEMDQEHHARIVQEFKVLMQI